MRTFKQNLWIACLVFLSAATCSITLAETASQGVPTTGGQGQTQAQTAEERRKALEKLLQDLPKTTPPAQTPLPTTPLPTPAAPAPSALPGIVQRAPLSADQIQLKYDNAPLYDFITQIADMLGITPILIDPDVKGTVYIYSSAPMSKQDVFPIFNIVLKNNNAALVKSGNFYKIVPISQGLKEGLEIVDTLPPPPPKPAQDKETPKKTDEPVKPPDTVPPSVTPVQAANAVQTPPGAAAGQTPPGATAAANPFQAQATPAAQTRPATPRLATHIIRAEFVPVQSLVEPIKLFMTEGGVIMPYERQNMLIITDYTDNVQKLLEVVHLLDNTYMQADLVELIEIKYNMANDVLDDLKKVFGGGKDSNTGINMVALDRLNAILVMANSKRALEEVKRWIKVLDTTTGRSVQTFIYPVENGTASNIAGMLSLLFGGDSGTTTGGQQTGAPGQTGTGVNQRGTTGQGGLGTGTGLSNTMGGSRSISSTGGGNSMYSGGMGQQGFGQQGYGQQGYGQQGGGGAGSPYGYGAGVFGGQGGGGPRLNQGYGMFAQVLNGGQFSGLQGMVRLVADDMNNSLIIQGSAADYAYLLDTIKRMDVLPRQVIIDARIFEIDLTDALSFGVSATLQGRTDLSHLVTGAIAGETGALSASSFAFIGATREILMNLSTLRQKTKVRILEAPSVLALDGTPARIQVGGSVPVPAMSYVAPAGGATTGVNYTDTGTSLDITPHISASGMVTLQIYHDVRSPGASTALGPSFSTTNVETTLAVKDGESVAIAGMIRESDSNARNGVPLLSQIPILGALFGGTTHSSLRTELLIMITPHVIRTPDRFREMTEDIQDSLRNVGKYSEEKTQQMQNDLEKGRQEREKLIKKANPPAPTKKKKDKPADPPQVIKNDGK